MTEPTGEELDAIYGAVLLRPGAESDEHCPALRAVFEAGVASQAARIAELERETERLIERRDEYHDAADELAYAIANEKTPHCRACGKGGVMLVETSLAEMLLNAIAAGRIWRVQFSRKHGADPGDERRTFEDLNKVIERRLESTTNAARKQGLLANREQAQRISELEAENARLRVDLTAAQLSAQQRGETVLQQERELASAFDRGRASGRADVAKYSHAIGRIESAVGHAGARRLSETVAAVEALKSERDTLTRELAEAKAYGEGRNDECNSLQRALNMAAEERDRARRELAEAREELRLLGAIEKRVRGVWAPDHALLIAIDAHRAKASAKKGPGDE